MEGAAPTIFDLRKRVRRDRSDGEALHAAGVMSGVRGDHLRSFVFHRAAAACHPDNAKFLLSCGSAALALSRIGEAGWYIDRSLTIDAQNAMTWKIRGDLHLDHFNRPDDAFRSYLRAIELAPEDPGNYVGAARSARHSLGTGDAMARLRRELPACANPIHFEHGMAAALADEGQYEEAIQILEGVPRESPEDQTSLRMLAQLYTGLRNFDAAEAYYARAAGAGTNPHAAIGYIMHWWRMGDFERARQIFRSKMLDPLYEGIFGSPERRWEGQSLRGKTLRLDVGATYFGDAVQFARFANVAKDAGARVILQCPKRIRSLLETVEGVDKAIAPFEPIPNFDYEAGTVWDLFRLPSPIEATIRGTPYLRAPAHLRAEWRTRIPPGAGKNAGIVWRGSGGRTRDPYGNRSIRLEDLRQLAEVPGVTLYSLQAEPGRSELRDARPAFPAIDLASDFPNIAAAIEALDVVITIDTSIAHLAGALGKRTFVMLPYDAYFLWLVGREDTPWYAGTRLFRQTEPGNWQEVIKAVGRALSQ
jgi:Flp pilus assembly protein TadD